MEIYFGAHKFEIIDLFWGRLPSTIRYHIGVVKKNVAKHMEIIKAPYYPPLEENPVRIIMGIVTDLHMIIST